MKEISTQEELDQLTNEGPVVLDFFAPWCGPCRSLMPLLEEVDKERDDVTIVKCNVDDAVEFANSASLGGIPTLKYYKKGGYLNATTSGIVTRERLISLIEGLNE